MIRCQVNTVRSSTSVIGSGIPNGPAVLSRLVTGQVPYLLRGGSFTVATSGFVKEDSEVPFGIPITYELLSTPANRRVQRNLMPTPTFAHGIQGWLAGPNRTTSIVTDTSAASGTAGRFTSNTSQSNVLVARAPITALPSAPLPYLLTGRVKFTTPDLWLWQDVKNVGTWAALKAAKANWSAVRSASTTSSVDYLKLFVSITNPATGAHYVNPVQVLIPESNQVNHWTDFSFFFDVPTGIPATAEIRFSHSVNVREYAVTWNFDRIGITPGEDFVGHDPLYYIDGDMAVPANPQNNLLPDRTWTDVSKNASITWDGLVGNSTSTYLAPAVVSSRTVCLVTIPDVAGDCSPVYLNDPVAPSRGQWFSLIEMGPLAYAARQSLFDVIGRGPTVAVSQTRGWATGSLTLLTRTLQDRDMALSTLETGRIVLYRNPDPAYPESSWYLAIGDVQESRPIPDARRPERIWVIPFTRVERPVGLIEQAAGVTWQQAMDAWQTWAQLRDGNPTWLDLLYPSGERPTTVTPGEPDPEIPDPPVQVTDWSFGQGPFGEGPFGGEGTTSTSGTAYPGSDTYPGPALYPQT